MPLRWLRPDWPSRCSMPVGAHFEPCCSTSALTQACGLIKSMKRFPPRPAACVTAALALKAGDRVKTDRRDAEKLARCYRSGDLTAVWVPDAAHEALRDLVRARLAAKRDQLRARNRLSKFLMRQGRRAPEGATAWTVKYMDWVKQQHFEHAAQEATLVDYLHEVEHVAERIVRLDRDIDAAVERTPETLRAVIAGLQSLRGIAKISAVTLGAELGQLSRFAHPRQLMGYSGAVSREHTSRPQVRRGPISKAGNPPPWRIVTELAWAERPPPSIRAKL